MVPLCVPEDRSERASREAGLDSAIVTWWATRVECASAIARLRRVGELTTAAEGRALEALNRLAGLWHEVDPSDRVRSLASILIRRHVLRAGGALQLAAAFDWANNDPTGRGFVTFDVRLAAAAALEGFTVIGGV